MQVMVTRVIVIRFLASGRMNFLFHAQSAQWALQSHLRIHRGAHMYWGKYHNLLGCVLARKESLKQGGVRFKLVWHIICSAITSGRYAGSCCLVKQQTDQANVRLKSPSNLQRIWQCRSSLNFTPCPLTRTQHRERYFVVKSLEQNLHLERWTSGSPYRTQREKSNTETGENAP